MDLTKLPDEIWYNIFDYLSFYDRLQCCLVSKSLLRIYREAPLKIHRETAVIYRSDDQLSDRFGEVLKSNRVIGSLELYNVSMSMSQWDSQLKFFISNLTSLTFDNCQLTSKDLFSILKHATNLKSLAFIDCRDLFMPGLKLFNSEESETLSKVLVNVKELNLSDNTYINDVLFEELMKLVPSVQSINLSGCRLYKLSGPDSPSVLTVAKFLTILAERASDIKEISLNNSKVEDSLLQGLSGVPGLSLTSFNIKFASGTSEEALVSYCKQNPKLTNLQVASAHSFNFNSPAENLGLFSTLKHLKTLCLMGISMVEGFDACLAELKCIQNLDLYSSNIPSKHVVKGFQLKGNSLVVSLNLSGISFSTEEFTEMLPFLSNLTTLEWRGNHLTNDILHLANKNLRNLRFLVLENNHHITDLGFAGIENSDLATEMPPKSPNKIFLGSQAEANLLQEIWNEKSLAAIESSSLSPNDSSKIDNLNLTKICLSGCNISDRTCRLAFEFRDLRHLDLSHCTWINDVGFYTVASKNPSIETLILTMTHITDKGLLKVVQCLPRLVNLGVLHCLSLTKKSVTKLPDLCQNLKYLDIIGSRNFDSETIQFLRTSRIRFKHLNSTNTK